MAQTGDFEFSLEGEGVRPETVPISELLAMLTSIERALRIIAKEQGASNDELFLSLVDIKEGSDTAVLRASPAMARSAKKMKNAISSRDYREIPIAARSQVKNVLSIARKSGRYTGVSLGGAAVSGSSSSSSGTSGEEAKFTIPVETVIPTTRRIAGPSTIYGTCELAGGATDQTAAARIRVNGKSIAIRLATKELAEELGRQLYREIGLEGTAEWDFDSAELVSFTAVRLLNYQSRGAGGKALTNMDRLRALAAASGDRWDDVDPDAFIRDQRHD